MRGNLKTKLAIILTISLFSQVLLPIAFASEEVEVTTAPVVEEQESEKEMGELEEEIVQESEEALEEVEEETISEENVEAENTKEDIFPEENSENEDMEENTDNKNDKLRATPITDPTIEISLDGVEQDLVVGEKMYIADVDMLYFIRYEEFEYNLSYQITNLTTGKVVLPETLGQYVNLVGYTEEGIYEIGLIGYDMFGMTTDIQNVYYLVQNTESFVNVDSQVNPDLIEVGRVEDGFDGSGSSYTWVIKKSDGNVVMQGTDEQPHMDEIYRLENGSYTITNTVAEKYPSEFGDKSVTADTANGFLINQGTVIIEYLDEEGNPIPGFNTIIEKGKVGDKLPEYSQDIPEYELVSIEGDPTGNYIDDTVEIKYVYKKIEKLPEIIEPTESIESTDTTEATESTEETESNGSSNSSEKPETSKPNTSTEAKETNKESKKSENRLPKTGIVTAYTTLFGLSAIGAGAYFFKNKKDS